MPDQPVGQIVRADSPRGDGGGTGRTAPFIGPRIRNGRAVITLNLGGDVIGPRPAA